VRLVSSDIDRFARRHGLRRGVEAAAVISAARTLIPSVFPPTLAADIDVAWYRDGTLALRTPSGSARALINQYRGLYTKQLQGRLGAERVRRVVLDAYGSFES
jgi:hypothetical protein